MDPTTPPADHNPTLQRFAEKALESLCAEAGDRIGFVVVAFVTETEQACTASNTEASGVVGPLVGLLESLGYGPGVYSAHLSREVARLHAELAALRKKLS